MSFLANQFNFISGNAGSNAWMLPTFAAIALLITTGDPTASIEYLSSITKNAAIALAGGPPALTLG